MNTYVKAGLAASVLCNPFVWACAVATLPVAGAVSVARVLQGENQRKPLQPW